jgi:hypothetical protein
MPALYLGPRDGFASPSASCADRAHVGALFEIRLNRAL